tara:strand:+ start:1113 stop:1226 length:114 start_codon:yes stop_codon:yes gene_type:complete
MAVDIYREGPTLGGALPGRAHPPPRLPVAGGWEIFVA